jgi:hypothetical protein
MNMQTVSFSDSPVDDLLAELTLARSRFPLPCDCLRAEQTHQVKKFEVEGATLSRWKENSGIVKMRNGTG